MKVLFCGAHPDDAEIYAFGTLFAYRAAGADVVLLMATNGEEGSAIRSPHQPLAVTRAREAQASADRLGAKLIRLDLPDGGLWAAHLHLCHRLGLLFAAEAPDVIITHSGNDYHADHRALSAAVTLAAADRCPIFYTDTMKGEHFQPSFYVDISAHQEAKFACLRLHHSQMPRRYVLMAQELAQQRGKQATGTDTALMEAFRHDPRPKFKVSDKLLPPGTLKHPAPA